MYTDLRAPALTLSFVEVRVRDAPSMLPSVKLALSFEGVRAVYNNRAFASIENAMSAPPQSRRDAPSPHLESLSAAQVRWQYLTLRLMQRARERLLQPGVAGDYEMAAVATASDDDDDDDDDDEHRHDNSAPAKPASAFAIQYTDHASWCRLLAARVARNPPHWLKWTDLSIFLEAMLTKFSLSVRSCVVSLPQQVDTADSVPRLDFVVPHAQMRSLTRSGRALGAMVLSGELVDVLVVLAQPETAVGDDGDDAAVDEASDALRALPYFYSSVAGAVRATVVLRKDKLAARLVSRLNWHRSPNDALRRQSLTGAGPVPAFVGDLKVRLPIDELRVFGSIVRSLGARTAAPVTARAHSASAAAQQKYHFRVFARHARAAVDCAGSKTSHVLSTEAVQSLALESRAASLAVALLVNGDLPLVLDFDALLCHCVSDDVTILAQREPARDGGGRWCGDARQRAAPTRRGHAACHCRAGARRPRAHAAPPVRSRRADGRRAVAPSLAARGHELRMQPRVSHVLRSMWRAVRGSVDDKVSPINPSTTQTAGLDVTRTRQCCFCRRR
jgi:hypothetical protein